MVLQECVERRGSPKAALLRQAVEQSQRTEVRHYIALLIMARMGVRHKALP